MRLSPASSLASAVLSFAVASAGAGPAAAGPLSEVAHGVENKAETHSSESHSSPPPSDNTPPPSHSYDDSYYSDPTACSSCGSGAVYIGHSGDGTNRGSIVLGPGRLDLYLGAHSVVDSDGAIVSEVRASRGWIGISANNTSYFERVEAGVGEAPGGKPGSETVRVDLSSVALNVRFFAAGGSELWIDGGLGFTGSSEYDSMVGTAWGLRAEHAFRPQLHMVSQGRLYVLENDVNAFEGWVGVRAWFVALGYRATQFNVGPALHGPEAGVALRF